MAELDQNTEQVQETTVDTEVENKTTENTTEQTPELTPIEQKAMEMGWRPKSEFDGDEEDFIDATEFVRRKPLFEKIDHQGRELREMKKALKALQSHHQQVKEAEYKRAYEDLKEAKKIALREGDEDALVEVDEKLAELKIAERVEQRKQEQEVVQPHPNFVRWVESNKWYAQDAELRQTADQIGVSYAAAHPDLSPDEVLDYVGKRIKKVYPEKFTNVNKSRPSAVEGGSSSVASKPTPRDTFELTDEERKIMNTFVRSNVMTKEEYIAELKRVKGIK